MVTRLVVMFLLSCSGGHIPGVFLIGSSRNWRARIFADIDSRAPCAQTANEAYANVSFDDRAGCPPGTVY